MEKFKDISISPEALKTKKEVFERRLKSRQAELETHLKFLTDENLDEKQKEQSGRRVKKLQKEIEQLKEKFGEKDLRPFCKICESHHYPQEEHNFPEKERINVIQH